MTENSEEGAERPLSFEEHPAIRKYVAEEAAYTIEIRRVVSNRLVGWRAMVVARREGLPPNTLLDLEAYAMPFSEIARVIDLDQV